MHDPYVFLALKPAVKLENSGDTVDRCEELSSSKQKLDQCIDSVVVLMSTEDPLEVELYLQKIEEDFKGFHCFVEVGHCEFFFIVLRP